MNVFDDVASALSSVTGMGITSAGYLLGLIVVVVFTIAIAWVLSVSETDVGRLTTFFGGVIVAFVTLVGWWPVWIIVLAAIVILYAIMNPFGGEGGI